MRLVVSILLSLFIAAFFAITAQAADLVGSRATPLSSSHLDAASQDVMNSLCSNLGIMTYPNKSVCERTLAQSPLSQTSYNYCMTKAPTGKISMDLLDCIDQLGGADYPIEYIKACEKTASKFNSGIPISSIKLCVQYLANTQVQFDSRAFALCFRANDNHFKKMKPCLNAIRDRVIDTQKLEQECFSDGHANNSSSECIEKMADSMPSVCFGRSAASVTAAEELTSPIPEKKKPTQKKKH